MSNRVVDYAEMIQGKLDALDNTKLAELETSMSITAADHFGYQDAQSRAFASGRLTFEEAQTVYLTLGENFEGDWPKGTTLAVKFAITQMVGELLGVA